MRAHTAAFVASLIAFAGTPAALAQDAAQPSNIETATSGPRLTLNTNIVDFGDVDDSEVVTKVVTITNTGDAVLEIGKINVTCGCTASEVEQSSLQPGESTQLEVRFNPNRRTGDQHGKRISIESNDPTGGAEIGLKAFVIPRVITEPQFAAFGKVLQGESGTVELVITGMTEDFKVLAASVDREDSFSTRIVKTEIVEREHPRTGQLMNVGQTTIAVSMTEQARIGRVDGSLLIETNDEGSPKLTLRATAGVTGDISSEPTRISLSALAPGQEFEQTIRIVSAKSNPFTIKKARLVTKTMSEEDREAIMVSYEPLPSDSGEVGYTLTVKGTATDTMRIIQGKIILMTDAPGQRVLSTPISGVVRVQTARQ
jgi:archaellum component FlaF (FlaF/FlaG flagellin family)